MESNKKYVTEITGSDLKQIAAAANAYPGVGINIERTDEGLEISVDREQLSRWVRTIIDGGKI